MTPPDLWAFSAVALLLCAVAFLASYIPGYRTWPADPTVASRYG